jgi:hypothetical protein
MKSIALKGTVFLMVVFFCTPVFAQEKTSFSVTPRVWFASMDLPFEDYASYETFSLPMYGATVAVRPSFTPNVSFLLTVLTGSGDGEGVFAWNESANIDADRTDAELLARYSIPNTSFSLYGGLRYVTFDNDQAGTIVYDVTGTGVFDVFRAKTETDIWVAEVGLGAVANITESGRHRFFSNFTFGMSFSDWDYSDNEGFASSGDDSAPMIDFNAGYQYSINERMSLSARYRLFTILSETEVIDDVSQDKLVTIHGPEASFTVNF